MGSIHKYILATLTIATLLCSQANAQPPTIRWQKCLGGTLDDHGYAIVQTRDHNFVVAGEASSSDFDCVGNRGVGTTDVFVAELDSNGTVIWERMYGSPDDEGGYSVVQTQDSGFAVAGWTVGRGGGDVTGVHTFTAPDIWVIKLDPNGNLLWERCYGGSGDESPGTMSSLIATSDNGLALIGSTTSNNNGDISGFHPNPGLQNKPDVWVLKLDPQGNREWQRCFGGTGNDVGASVTQTSDGGYALTGLTDSRDGDVTGNHGGVDMWVVKLNAAGAIEWQHTYGGSSRDEGHEIIQTADGGYAIAGLTMSHDGDVAGQHDNNDSTYDIWIVRLDQSGKSISQRSYGGSANEVGFADLSPSMIQTSDRGLAFVGSTYSSDGDLSGLAKKGGCDIWLAKLSVNGNFEWQELLGGSQADVASQLIRTFDGGYALIGTTASNDGDVSGNHSIGRENIWVVRFNCIPTALSVYLKPGILRPAAGDSVDIPIYISSSPTATALSELSTAALDFSMNTDLIAPVRFIPAITGVTVSAFTVGTNSASVALNISGDSAVSVETILGTLRCASFLTDTVQSEVTLTDGSLVSSVPNCLSTSVTRDSMLVVQRYQCGDSTLTHFLKYDSLSFRIISIEPNPSTHSFTVTFKNNAHGVRYQVVDGLGVVRTQGWTGESKLTIEDPALPSGRYFFRALSPGSIPVSLPIVIVR